MKSDAMVPGVGSGSKVIGVLSAVKLRVSGTPVF